ncbi:uncharacterized protein LOC132309058 [Cornus florida]|uniref:uncharacterized protein LOC132309058 n=1 Tax=Cornus florida TaxID=4283 RepID=UPI0028973418|nr:uncharacterized protein LOC132309058 [Cornus florida]XP_059663400.1 uncharacterized protein LOC132309058 [Cornus florida]XP_059663407.1 uncharacterized protein LOC132309058 [Cornus florida]
MACFCAAGSDFGSVPGSVPIVFESPIEEKQKLNEYDCKKDVRFDDSFDYVSGDDSDSDGEEKEVLHYEDEEVEYGDDGYHEITRKESHIYNARAKATDGFSVPYFPKAFALCMITPVRGLSKDKETLERISNHSKRALQSYNKAKESDYEFVRVIKANTEILTGILYYITFEAKDGKSGEPQIFQAKVLRGITDVEVLSCIPKRAIV